MSESSIHEAGIEPKPYNLDVGDVVRLGPWGRDHSRCACSCPVKWACPACGLLTAVRRTKGRWGDGHTARPYEPVWVELFCGCTFGDESLAYPRRLPEVSADQ